MAQEEVILKLGADVSDAKRDLETVKKGVEDIGSASKKTAKATKGIQNGIKGVGVALKAAGIGLALKAFEMLSEIFMQNQKTANFFNTAFEAVSIAINDFVNFVFNNGQGVVNFFKDIFENPLESVKSLGQAIHNNMVERFESFLDTLGYVGAAITKFFKGDFSGALDSLKDAGKESLDVLTGVNNVADKVAEGVGKAVEATTNYVKETVKAAKVNVELERAAGKSAAQIQGLIEKYDRQAEKLRQVRDDENATFEDRIKANEKLGEVLQQQQEQMLALASIEVQRAQVQFDKLKNDENEIALIEAKNELAAIEAQITGFQSEQLTNQVSLTRELEEAKRELYLEGLDEREREVAEVEAHYEELFKVAKKAGQDTVELEKQKAAAITEIRRTQTEADLGIVTQSLANMRAVMGEESEAAKALAVMEATINTYTAATAALAPPPVGAGPVLGPILAATTVAAGLANVTKIMSTEEPKFAMGGIVGGYGTGTSDSIGARLSKDESVINARSTRMYAPLLSAINEAGGGRAFAGVGTGTAGMGGVVKAYVVADDMTDEQEKLAKIRRRATI